MVNAVAEYNAVQRHLRVAPGTTLIKATSCVLIYRTMRPYTEHKGGNPKEGNTKACASCQPEMSQCKVKVLASILLMRDISVVEGWSHKPFVAGSTPAPATTSIGRLERARKIS